MGRPGDHGYLGHENETCENETRMQVDGESARSKASSQKVKKNKAFSDSTLIGSLRIVGGEPCFETSESGGSAGLGTGWARISFQKLDQDMMLSRGLGPSSSLTVTPRLDILMGRSALRPGDGLMKHHAGTAPSSTSPENPLRPTIHHPSSKEFITDDRKEQ